MNSKSATTKFKKTCSKMGITKKDMKPGCLMTKAKDNERDNGKPESKAHERSESKVVEKAEDMHSKKKMTVGAKLAFKKSQVVKLKVNNKIKGYGDSEKATNTIRINLKKHKGDKKEIKDTLQHEANHLLNWKASEKKIRDKTYKQLN
jgi:hypothetical protein